MSRRNERKPTIGLVSSEPVRRRVAGIGIRYMEFTQRLPQHGIETILISLASPEETAELGIDQNRARQFERGRLEELTEDCDSVLAQGDLASVVLDEVKGKPIAIDVYDPFLIEHLGYYDELGREIFDRDQEIWVKQFSKGDFFLCSSYEQRLFYIGFMTALGRINPLAVQAGSKLEHSIGVVPFGVPSPLPAYQPYLPPKPEGRQRLLFGGIYDWYDPWTVLEALQKLEEFDWEIIFVRNPNPDTTPQSLFSRVEQAAEQKGWLGTRVRIIDWVPANRRFDLLQDIDIMVAPHLSGLETEISLRTRFLEALAVGRPILTSEGGALARIVSAHDAGFVSPVGDHQKVAESLEALFLDKQLAKRVGNNARELAKTFTWDIALQELIKFCRNPQFDPHKDFARKREYAGDRLENLCSMTSEEHYIQTSTSSDPALESSRYNSFRSRLRHLLSKF